MIAIALATSATPVKITSLDQRAHRPDMTMPLRLSRLRPYPSPHGRAERSVLQPFGLSCFNALPAGVRSRQRARRAILLATSAVPRGEADRSGSENPSNSRRKTFNRRALEVIGTQTKRSSPVRSASSDGLDIECSPPYRC